MNIIVNADKNWAIGKNGGLLFRLKQDMKFFKAHTIDNIVVMGRKTLQSLPGGKPLPGRTNIVLSANPDFACDGAIVCNNGGELAELLKDTTRDIYIIGGESLYRDLLPFCDTAYVTRVDAEADSPDAFMVDLDNAPGWRIASVSDEMEEDGIKFKFITYKKVAG